MKFSKVPVEIESEKMLTSGPTREMVVMGTKNYLGLYENIHLQWFAGATHYIRSGLAHNGDGTTWGAAASDGAAGAFNAIPAMQVRGDTYYIATGTYAAAVYDQALSGTTRITFKGATAADHGTDTGWSASYGVDVTPAHFSNSGEFNFKFAYTGDTGYYTIDGNCGSGKTTGSYGFVMDAPASGNQYCFICGFNNHNCPGMIFKHIYAKATTAVADRFFVCTSTQVGSFTYPTISNCYADSFQGFINSYVDLPTGFLVERNYIMNGWNDEPTSHHGEDININSTVTGATIRYNWFEGRNGGTGVIVGNNGLMTASFIYGNVFKDCIFDGNGIITDSSSGKISNNFIYNNTFIHCNVSGGWFHAEYSQSSGNTLRNNLLYDMDAGYTLQDGTADYNAYFSCSGVPSETHGQSSATNPFVDSSGGNYHLSGHTTGGVNLGSPYDVDMDGVTRTTWDRGAYEYAGSPPAPMMSYVKH